MEARSVQVPRVHFDGGLEPLDRTDCLVIEEPLELRINGRPLTVTMRTPGDDFELATGFLLTEQIIRSKNDILELRRPDTAPERSNIVEVSVPPSILRGKSWTRNFLSTSSCGVCGKSSLDQIRLILPAVESTFSIDSRDLTSVPISMRKAQSLFDETGGLHAAALFDSSGTIAVLREDVGRHNAVDKVIGWAVSSDRIPATPFGLFVSGRTSFEILQKAAAAGIPLVASVSAPSSLALSLAREHGVTLAGFVRGNSFNVYSHPERIVNE